MIKVREKIEIANWVEGSGYSFSQTLENRIVEMPSIEYVMTTTMEDYAEYFEGQVSDEGEEDEITVTFTKYDPDIDPMFDDEEVIFTLEFTLNQMSNEKEEG